MGRGRSVYLGYTALVLLSVASTSCASSIWDVSIDESPAPPPGKGPPFSAHASRNPALIPYQVIGVVAAYIGSVLIVGSFVLTVGRTRRKKAQSMASDATEMVKPLATTFERTPTSPTGSSHWYSPRRLREKKSATSSVRSVPVDHGSPGMESIASFDTNVLEADRQKRQAEMERLYAAVMAQDESGRAAPPRAGTATTTDMPPEYRSANAPGQGSADHNSRQQQPRGAATGEIGRASSFRAIYPPDDDLPITPMSPASPVRAEYPTFARSQPSAPQADHSRGPSSSNAGSSASSAKSPSSRKFRKSLRNIKISSPIVRRDEGSDNDQTPLSPRYYADPGTPPEPPTAGTMQSVGFPPSTPGMDDEHLDQVRDLPHPNPQRLSAHMYQNPAQLVTDVAAEPRPGPVRASGTGILPLRELNRQYVQQAQTAQAGHFPLSPGQWNAKSPTYAYQTSAGPVKTTFLDARRDRLGGGPATGAPTPYSPYMPFTPLTPVTPHLTSKAERKQREKEEKRFKKPIMEEDAVADEKDLWSSGY